MALCFSSKKTFRTVFLKTSLVKYQESSVICRKCLNVFVDTHHRNVSNAKCCKILFLKWLSKEINLSLLIISEVLSFVSMHTTENHPRVVTINGMLSLYRLYSSVLLVKYFFQHKNMFSYPFTELYRVLQWTRRKVTKVTYWRC